MNRRVPAALAVLAALSQTAARGPEVTGRCSVTFSASATLHDFAGTAPCAALAIEPQDDGAYRARAEVAVAQLDTGISARNQKMREMFEADRHPRISAAFADVDPDALRENRRGALAFRISIHGVERAVIPEVSGWSEVPGKSARFRAAFDVSLSDFALEAPVAMGLVRVKDRVHVEVDVELTEAKASSGTR